MAHAALRAHTTYVMTEIENIMSVLINTRAPDRNPLEEFKMEIGTT